MQTEFERLLKEAKAEGKDMSVKLKEKNCNGLDDFAAICPQFGLGCDPMDLSELGSGYPLYFNFLKFLILLLLMYAVFLVPVMMRNVQCSIILEASAVT